MAEQPQETDKNGSEIEPINDNGGLLANEDGDIKISDSHGELGTGDFNLPKPNDYSEASTTETLIRGRYFVDSSSPFPDLDTPTARAYKVTDIHNNGEEREFFGLVCSPNLPSRIRIINFQRKHKLNGMLPIIDWAPISWPPLGQSTMVIVYEKPKGDRIIDQISSNKLNVDIYDIPLLIAKPILSVIEGLEAQKLCHRSISAQNLFFFDKKMKSIVLGDNASAPPGFHQESIYEPIERAMCNPEGRGEGETSDDIYALGVTIGVLLLGFNPMKSLEQEDQIRERITRGSFDAIFGKANFSAAAKEISTEVYPPLQGMMHDNSSERWKLENVENWIDSQTPHIVQPITITPSLARFSFKNKNYNDPRLLALDFITNIPEASQAIQTNNDFTKWLSHIFKEKTKVEAVKLVLQSAEFHKTGFQGADDYIVAKICTILDPKAPIRYKGLKFMPDGFAATLASAATQKNKLPIAAEILNHDIPTMWLDSQEDSSLEIKNIRVNFARLKKLFGNNKLGGGIERVLYALNPSLRCLSPYFFKDYIVTIEQLLPALDAAANDSDTQLKPMDRHIIAFIDTKYKLAITKHLIAINSTGEDKVIIGLLSLFAEIQMKLEQGEMLALSSWIGGLLGPAIESYRSLDTRAQIKKSIPQLVRSGSLPELFNLVEDPSLRIKDQEEYAIAKMDWQAAEEEISKIESDQENRTDQATKGGKKGVAILSIILSIVFISVLFILEIW